MKPKKASLAAQARSVPVVLVVSCLLITLCSYLLKRSEATTYLGDRAHAIFRLANTGRRAPNSRIGDAAWASLTLAHNLSSPPSATLQLFYEQQVLALLSHTELINWAWSRARDRFCRCTWRTPSPQVGGWASSKQLAACAGGKVPGALLVSVWQGNSCRSVGGAARKLGS